MHEGDDRDALLFGSISSQASSEAGDAAPAKITQLVADAKLFPENQSPACLTLQCRSDKLLDKDAENDVSVHQNDMQKQQQPIRRHRHISLFASIELIRPRAPQTAAHEEASPSSATEPSQQFIALPGAQVTNLLPVAPAVREAGLLPCNASGVSSTHSQAPTNEDPPLHPTEQESASVLVDRKEATASTSAQCSCGRPNQFCCGGVNNKHGDVPPVFKPIEGFISGPSVGNVEAHRFVAQELQEEEKMAATVAAATNALRQHAQQLLNQAADKLERLATQQRRRTEAAAEKAAALLSRATEARCALHRERNMLEQMRRRQGCEQQLKLKAANEALDAERRRCIGLEARLEALQHENRHLRAALALRTQQPHARGPVHSRQLTGTDAAASARRPRQAFGCQPTARCTSVQGPAETASLTAVVLPAGPPAKAPRGGCLSCPRQAVKTGAAACRSAEAGARQAVVDVEVRLPPSVCQTAAARAPCSEPQANEANSTSAVGEGGEGDSSQQQPQGHPCPPQTEAPPHDTGETSDSKGWQRTRNARKHAHRNRSAGSSAFRTDESISSSGSTSSSNKPERRRRWRQRRRYGSARMSRSVSRGSVSTSSSSAAPEREEGRRRSHSTKSTKRAPQHPRISFSVPQPTLQQQTDDDESSSGSSSLPRRARTNSHKLALREDVAGRLQASLLRLQERQALQGKIQSIARQLLHPQ
ncbi:hypothetical protein, conserved [Eimeria brunetti]|uniref:Uncharacterized protein n=1 Tax=Eimeria brunetti TaxID=51314 RepID=U6L7U2_9EIME|nr:hypothetical protein, conserved [Eimeria brunetti]